MQLIALGAVIRGETYHFEIVSDRSSEGIERVSYDFDIPVANGCSHLRKRRAVQGPYRDEG